MNDRPSEADIAEAIIQMSETIPFFPSGQVGAELVRQSLANLVSTTESLRWLVYTAVNTMAKFSLPELRAIYCTRYAPGDGIATASAMPGFRPEETSGQQRYLAREAEETERKLAAWKREKAHETGQQQEPMRAPAAKPFPKSEARPECRRREGPTDEQVIVPRARARTPEENETLIAKLEEQLKKRSEEQLARRMKPQ